MHQSEGIQRNFASKPELVDALRLGTGHVHPQRHGFVANATQIITQESQSEMPLRKGHLGKWGPDAVGIIRTRRELGFEVLLLLGDVHVGTVGVGLLHPFLMVLPSMCLLPLHFRVLFILRGPILRASIFTASAPGDVPPARLLEPRQ